VGVGKGRTGGLLSGEFKRLYERKASPGLPTGQWLSGVRYQTIYWMALGLAAYIVWPRYLGQYDRGCGLACWNAYLGRSL